MNYFTTVTVFASIEYVDYYVTKYHATKLKTLSSYTTASDLSFKLLATDNRYHNPFLGYYSGYLSHLPCNGYYCDAHDAVTAAVSASNATTWTILNGFLHDTSNTTISCIWVKRYSYSYYDSYYIGCPDGSPPQLDLTPTVQIDCFGNLVTYWDVENTWTIGETGLGELVRQRDPVHRFNNTGNQEWGEIGLPVYEYVNLRVVPV